MDAPPHQAPRASGGYAWSCWGTLVAGILQIVWGSIMTGVLFTALIAEGGSAETWEEADLPPNIPVEFVQGALVAGFGVLTAAGAIAIAGAISALRRRRWWLAFAGAVVAIGTNGLFLCPVGPIFGIWLAALLVRTEVRESFDDQRPAPADEDGTPWR